jgi:phosphatidate cytidylyltransferase
MFYMNNCLYFYLFIAVLTFKKGLFRFQLSQLMWTIATLCLVVGQCKALGSQVMNGLFWFFFPMATVVMNDVSAYFCGITMGKKFIKAPFLELSPNKTWEGFIGGGVLTCIFSFFFPVLLAQFTWFTCPAESLSIIPPASATLDCEINSVFLPQVYEILPPDLDIFSSLGTLSLTLYPIQLHGLVYGLFAAIVAPFGGFMASAVKRAYGIKDFESFFPGHGGMMDRMDCQLLMLAFTWVHYNTFINTMRTPTVSTLLAASSLLTPENQMALYEKVIYIIVIVIKV